jgi:hypothetical protein
MTARRRRLRRLGDDGNDRDVTDRSNSPVGSVTVMGTPIIS